MKTVLTTDWHADLKPFLSSNVRSPMQDIVTHVDALVKEASNGDRLVHVGDVFDSLNPKSAYIDAVEEQFVRLVDVYGEVIVLEGNHTLGACAYLQHIGVNVIAKVEVIGDELFVPHCDDMQDAYTAAIKTNKIKRVFGHFEASGVGVSGAEAGLLARKAMQLKRHAGIRYYLGHIHKPFDVDGLHYIGSAIRCDFAERDEEKGYGVIDSKGMYTWEPVQVQRYFQLSLRSMPTDAVLRKCTGAVVKVIYTDKAPVADIRAAINAVGFIRQEETVRAADKKIVDATLKATTADLFSESLTAWIAENVKVVKLREDVDSVCREHLRGASADAGASRDVVITRIQLKNYGVFADSDVALTADLYGIIGRTDDNSDESNGSGKSLLVEAVLYALYGKTRSVVDEIVKDGETQCAVTVEFVVGEHTCRITRSYDTEKHSGSATLTVDGEIVARNSAIETYIETTLLRIGYGALVNTAFFTQDDQDNFAITTDAGRLDALKTYLNLEGIDRALKKVKGELSAVTTDVVLSKRDIELVVSQLSELSDISVSAAEKELTALQDELSESKGQQSVVLKQLQDASKAAEIAKAQRELKSRIEARKAELSEYEDQKRALSDETGDEVIEDISALTKKIEERQSTIATLQAQLDEVERGAQRYTTLAKSPKCPFELECPHLTSDKFMQSVNRELEARRAEYKRIKTALTSAEKGQTGARSEYADYKSAEKERQEQSKALVSVQARIDALEKQIAELVRDVKPCKESENNSKKLQSQYDAMVERAQEIAGRVAVLERVRDSREELTSRVKVLKSRNIVLEKKQSVYEHAAAALARDGFVLGFLRSGMDYISTEANAILRKFNALYSVTLEIVTARGTAGLNIKVIHSESGSVRAYSTYSGAQRSIITFALRLAIYRLLTLRGLSGGFLVLDEVLGKMDSHNRDIFIAVLGELTGTFKQVLCITHTSVKDIMPKVIEVTRSGSGSTVRVR